MHRAAREAIDEPAIDGAKGQGACLRPGPQGRILIQEPSQLGAGEVGIEAEPRLCGDLGLEALRAQRFAARSRAARRLAA